MDAPHYINWAGTINEHYCYINADTCLTNGHVTPNPVGSYLKFPSSQIFIPGVLNKRTGKTGWPTIAEDLTSPPRVFSLPSGQVVSQEVEKVGNDDTSNKVFIIIFGTELALETLIKMIVNRTDRNDVQLIGHIRFT